MLTIKNLNKMIGEQFRNNRFLCSNFEETPHFYRFWFKDTLDQLKDGGVWIKIARDGEWDNEYSRYMFKLSYPYASPHKVSADWFALFKNAQWTFEEALKGY